MTIDKVIELGKIASGEVETMSTAMTVAFSLLILGVVVAIFCTMYSGYSTIPSIIGLSIVLLAGMVFLVFELPKGSEKTIDLIEEWETDVVKPFLESLPVETLDIDQIYLTSNQEEGTEKTQLTVILNTGGSFEADSGIFEIKELPKDKTQPYMSFVTIEKDLGKGYPKGRYNKEIHLPKGYTFKQPNKTKDTDENSDKD